MVRPDGFLWKATKVTGSPVPVTLDDEGNKSDQVLWKPVMIIICFVLS